MAETCIVYQRLSNHRITGGKFATPEEAVRWMGALQAQDYGQSLWAVGLRTQSATMADIEQAIADRKIVRTWPMRGTLHFVPPEDAKWMLKLSAARMIARNKRRREQLELDNDVIARCEQLFYDALNGGRRLSRPEMMALLENAGISAKNQRGYHLLWYTAQTGLICPGPNQGKQQTFVLLDEWVPHSRELSREESLAKLAGRYFASHGPATIHDFAWWSGLTLAEARLGLEGAKSELLSDVISGQEYWMTGDSTVGDGAGFYLLPGFDEYLLGYKDRNLVLAPDYVHNVIPGKNGIFLPFIVIAGQVVGTWKRTLKKKSVDITLNPFTTPDISEERIFEEARRYSVFVGMPESPVLRQKLPDT